MGKLRINTSSKTKKLKFVVEKLHRSLLMGKRWSNDYSNYVPEDVKEGHFAVIAVNGERPRRFVISLSYLTHPKFLKLLEQAAEEYGFDHEGALTIPCRPTEIERLLKEQWQDGECSSISSNGGGGGRSHWSSCETMVQSC